MNGTQNSWIPRVITESVTDVIDETDTTKLRERRSSHNSLTPSPEQSFGKKLPQYNSFRVMKQKVIIIINNYIYIYIFLKYIICTNYHISEL